MGIGNLCKQGEGEEGDKDILQIVMKVEQPILSS